MDDARGGTGEPAAWVWRFHLGEASVTGTGRFEVRRGRRRLARLAATLLHLPEQGRNVPVRAAIERNGAREVWTRTFGSRTYTSRHERHGTRVLERLGPLELRFRVSADGDCVRFQQEGVGVRAAGLRVGLPARLGPRVRAYAEGRGQRPFFVRVEVSAPLAGDLLSYWGRLTEEK